MNGIHPGLFLEGYEFIETIAAGGFSSVWRVISQKFNRVYVAKVTHVKHQNMESAWQAFDGEIQALLRLDHPNIIGLFAHFRHLDNFVLILEYCQNGSLMDYMRDNGRMTGAPLFRTIRQIGSALRCAWEQGVHHRDIKPANILIDEKGNAKLVDFGISQVTQDSNQSTMKQADYRCSPICAAPELLNEIPHDPMQSDVWSFGVTILWLAGGAIPWNYANFEELLVAIKGGNYVMPDDLDSDVARLVKNMLVVNPLLRVFPTEKELGDLGHVKVEMARDTCQSFKRYTLNGRFLSSPVSMNIKSVPKNNSVLRGPVKCVMTSGGVSNLKGHMSLPAAGPGQQSTSYATYGEEGDTQVVVPEQMPTVYDPGAQSHVPPLAGAMCSGRIPHTRRASDVSAMTAVRDPDKQLIPQRVLSLEHSRGRARIPIPGRRSRATIAPTFQSVNPE